MECRRATWSRGLRFRTLVLLLVLGLTGASISAEIETGTGSADPIAIDPSLTVSFGWTVFSELDMEDTYGGIPWLGVEVSVPMDSQWQSFVSIEYGACSGDPYYNNPDFAGPETHLRAVPVTMGFRINGSSHPRFAVFLGFGLQVAWVEEEIPALTADGAATMRSDTGWGQGLLFYMAPEWRSSGGRLGIGLEGGWGGSSVEVGKGYDEHNVDLTGVRGRLSISWRL